MDGRSDLRRAVALHRQGDAAAAERLYRSVLAGNPADADALHLLGVLCLQGGRAEEAVQRLGEAVRLAPAHAAALVNFGNALAALRRDGEAVAAYGRALAAKPDHPDALLNRGNALARLGRQAAARADWERLLAVQPQRLAALLEQGNALRAQGRHAAALAAYDLALRLSPGEADALANRGVALAALGRLEEALESQEQALAARPAHAGALINRGNVLVRLGRHAEALASYDAALALAPGAPAALHNRGMALADLGRHEAALASYDAALARRPAHAETLMNRGAALRELGRHEEATAAFEAALGLAPELPYLDGSAFHSRLYCCDWRDYDAAVARLRTATAAGRPADLPFAFKGHTGAPDLQQACARTYAAHRFPLSARPLHRGVRRREGRLRLAYMSSNFRASANAHLMVELLERHDRSRFELFGIALAPTVSDATHRRMRQAFERFVDVGTSGDREAATQLHGLGIDIAVDLRGTSDGGRPGMLAHRPVPVQVNYLGCPGTIGSPAYDYILADRQLIPPEHDGFYDEAIVRLPDCYLPYDTTVRPDSQVPSRAASGLPETGFVFCCFNNGYKIGPAIFDVWMRLLRRVEGSVLWLLEDNPAAVRNLRREAESRGVAAGRLVFAPRAPLDVYLGRHRIADLFVDTLPCSAHTAAADALWAGLPLVTCMQGAFSGRVAGSVLHAAGLPELIAADLADYEALALALATEPGRLAAIRAKLARNRASCPLFDTDRLRRHMERAYLGMWERQEAGLPPAGFAVPAGA